MSAAYGSFDKPERHRLYLSSPETPKTHLWSLFLDVGSKKNIAAFRLLNRLTYTDKHCAGPPILGYVVVLDASTDIFNLTE